MSSFGFRLVTHWTDSSFMSLQQSGRPSPIRRIRTQPRRTTRQSLHIPTRTNCWRKPYAPTNKMLPSQDFVYYSWPGSIKRGGSRSLSDRPSATSNSVWFPWPWSWWENFEALILSWSWNRRAVGSNPRGGGFYFWKMFFFNLWRISHINGLSKGA